MNKKKNRLVICLCLLVFILSVSSLSTLNYTNFDDDTTLETSTDNYLFNGKEYDITLDDVYDDGDLSKIYTGANFQTVFLENESTTLNESVSVVDNNEHTHPDPADITMIDGVYDSSDNMKVLDSSYSDFDTNSYTPDVQDSGILYPTSDESPNDWDNPSGAHWSVIDGGTTTCIYAYSSTEDNEEEHFGFDSIDIGSATVYEIKVSSYIECSSSAYSAEVDINLGGWQGEQETNSPLSKAWRHNTWSELSGSQADVEGLEVRYIADVTGSYFNLVYICYVTVYYELLGDSAELNFTIESDLANYDDPDLLSLGITSYHGTNISETITAKIWNFDSTSYETMWSTSSTSVVKNYHSITSNVGDYFDGSGNVRIQYIGTNSSSDFELNIDYVEFRITYKMDLTHTISFETNGLWKYRWELIGSLQYTSWTYFEVVDPVPNFHAISESDYTTRWILQNSTINAYEDFHDDINTDYWDLVDVSTPNFTYSIIPTGDSPTWQALPDTNYGTSTYLDVIGSGGSIKKRSYVYFSGILTDYLFENQSGDNEIGLYASYVDNWDSDDLQCYNISSFIEGTITWNTQPAPDALQDSLIISSTGYNYFDISDLGGYYAFKWSDETTGRVDFRSKESAYDPIFRRVDVHKNYFGSGYMYMQTDTTETIGLKSQDYGTHKTLSSGDYFEVDFQTSSDSQIDLILLKDGEVQKSLVLSQSGNTNFGRHAAQVSVSEELEFDQLKISSTFEDQDNIKVYDIKTYKYTLTGDFADFYIGSHSTKSIYLTPYLYNLRIFEEGTKKLDINVTITSSDYYYSYQPTSNFQCRLTLHSTEGINLDITDFHISVNRSNGGSYSEFSLLDNTFNVDEGTMIYFEVSDRFDNLIDDFQQVASDYIDLELEVYQLQIKNLMEQQTTVDINGTQTFPVLSGELIEYILSKNYYEIGYYDMDNDYHQFITYLNSNQAFELNRSKICFLSYADQQGNHLSFDNYKTYINGSMIYEQIFYEDAGDDVLITITDRYDYEIYEDVYSVVSGDNYIPITLTMYSLKIMNQQEVFNHVNITRDPNDSGYFWSEWIAPGERIEFKLFAGDYIINLTDTENGWSSYGYELNGDDTLLFTSDNIISNVLINIANTNTTIGNLITYVQIDLTNQNTEINNSIISIVINIESINSTLGDLLIDIQTEITNIESSIISEIVDMGVQITNVNSSLSEQILTITTDISNLDSSITSQFLTLGVAIENINGSIIDQIVLLGVDITNINTSLSNQILSLEVDISNYNSSIVDQILLVIADIENIETVIDNQTLVILSDITNVNSTLLNQMVVLGVNITNINATITNQILMLNVDLTNINASISSLLYYMDIDITSIGNNITSFYAFTNTSFINLNNIMNTSFIYMENNIISINQTISNLVIGISNDIYLINGTISTMITTLENNLFLMNVSIDTALFNLDTTIDIIGANITSNYILLNNTLNIMDTNIDDSRIAMINNLLLVNNTISTLISGVYSSVYLINNSIYTAVIDLGTYLSLMNNTINGDLSFILSQNDFLTEIYQMTMFSELLNWTDIGLNTSLLTSQIDAWDFVNNYKNQSITVLLRYNDIIDNLTISAQNTIDQYLPESGVEYREWSEELQDYVGEWQPLPENRTVNFGFFETDVPLVPRPLEADFYLFIAFIIIISVISIILVISWAYMRKERDEVPEDTRLRHKRKKRDNLDWRKNYFDQT